MNIKVILVFSFLTITIGHSLSAQKMLQDKMIEKVNKIRSVSHYCGNIYMPASDPVTWNNTLFKSAMSHAKEMNKYKYFTHFSKKGESIGDRIGKFGYDWLIAGENIAIGQKTIDETLLDWLESKTHCEMMLNEHVTEIAIAKSGKYRVMHLGRR